MESILDWISANQQIIYIVILMIFVGIEVIGHVPSVLHTPLMSGANAIHGVVIIGATVWIARREARAAAQQRATDAAAGPGGRA